MTTDPEIVSRIIAPATVRRFGAEQTPTFTQEFRELLAYGHLLYSLVVRDLTVRYKRSFIGFLWTMLNPLLLMIIFVMIFSTLFRFAIVHYEIYFLSAYLPWNFFAQSTIGSMTSLGWNGLLMKHVRAPKSIFPLATTISGLVNLLLSMIPLALIMLVVKADFHPTLLFLPVSFLMLGLFTFGVSLALSSIAVYFTDVREMYNVATTALMYMTPIMYPLDIVPPKYLWIIKLNPMRYMLEIVRAPLYYGIIPPARTMWIATALTLGALVFGWMVFKRLSPRFYAHL
jgi:ABC-2 type transport system permease protein